MLDMDRRTFLGTMAAAALASRGGSAASIQQIGMQLYTVRTDLEKDFAGTIAKVAAIGYKEVEFAGYFNHTPTQVKETLTASGLTSPSAHIDYATLGPDKLPAALDAAHTIGHTFLVNPWIDESIRSQPGSWQRIAETYNRAGEACAKAGIQFAYHNHNFEFAPVDGKLPVRRPARELRSRRWSRWSSISAGYPPPARIRSTISSATRAVFRSCT